VRRARMYAEAGADVVFPILAPPELLPDITECVALPVNALCLPEGPSPAALGRLGVRRVTFGDRLQRRAAQAVHSMAKELAFDELACAATDVGKAGP